MATLVAFMSCQKNEERLTSASDIGVLYATIEDANTTRTTMDENNNILWSEGDQIVAFMKSSYGHKYQVKPSFVGKSYADFSMVSSGNGSDLSAGNEWEHNVAYYPYSDVIECLKTGEHYVLGVALPSEQSYVPESFGNGAMAMVAVSEDNNITFRNVLGGMKLQLRGTQKVVSVTLQGNNSEKLSGAATVTAYTDETKPAITMASGASASVTLNCGSGIQLNESTVTEFILALPPVLFSKGFTVTVTDSDSKTYTVETDKANTVLRSSLLTMPAFTLGNNPSEEQPGDDDLIIPVVAVSLNATSLKLCKGDTYLLNATVKPNDATDKTVVWSSDATEVAIVDQTGLITGVSVGTVNISASAGGKVAKCTITVLSQTDYIDEYGINHGKGIAVGKAIWAPVNCGYHATDYKYGKLYQWGRKYGQGYSGRLFDVDNGCIGEISDALVPTIDEGGVSAVTGQHNSKSNVFFIGTSEYSYDWLYPQNGNLWNSGSESKPVKTEYDPCPDGWRVPTYAELDELNNNYSSWTSEDGQNGRWFSGSSSYTETVPQVFFPAASYRKGFDGVADYRGNIGRYWSSKPYSTNAYGLNFNWNYVDIGYHVTNGGLIDRACGYSVRCVQVTD